ncbi:hypothetical protein BYT27DRAFT_7114369 [Phlegmacium glaucopus]|nr:hypothetical protein BYT27DRAFT_7114369 [Phlegmacium glaucopus]
MNGGNATCLQVNPTGSTKDIEVQDSIIRNHPIYWFDDGSLVLGVEVQRFKVHRTLLSRHSRFFASFSTPQEISCSDLTASGSPAVVQTSDHIVLEQRKEVKAEDVEALLQHLYHDVPLGNHSSFSQVASIMRVSGPKQLDFPHIHATALRIFENMFPMDPSSFTHDHPLHEALPLATELNVSRVRKAILYSLVTTTDFDATDSSNTQDSSTPSKADEPNGNAIITSIGVDQAASATVSENFVPYPVLSRSDAEICMTLMTRFIEHFTPILFTPAATPHMECTDVFADTWMSLVIQPALNNDGVYKPLETLERLKSIDWAKEGLCPSCVVEKREEWSEEQRIVWRLMDSWLEPTPLPETTP